MVVGKSRVGKTTLIRKEVRGRFALEYMTTLGIDFECKLYEMEDQKLVKAQIWDTAGHERWGAKSSAYFRGTHGLMICFDVTDESSFDEVDYWYRETLKYVPDACVLALVACKTDLEELRVISEESGKQLAKSYRMPYFETSAKTGEGVNECFNKFIRYWFKNQFDLHRDAKIFAESRRFFISELEFSDLIIDVILSILFTPQQMEMLKNYSPPADDAASYWNAFGNCQIS